MQRKANARAPALFLALVLLFSTAANAAVIPPDLPNRNYTPKCDPEVTFCCTRATCKLTVRALTGCTTADTLNLYESVESYFSVRRDAVNGCSMPRPLSDAAYRQLRDAVARAAAMRAFWKEWGVHIVSVETELRDFEVVRINGDGTIEVKANEWTWVNYNGKDENTPATDRMGFETPHEMTISAQEQAGFTVIKDSYDEYGMTHYGPLDFAESDAQWENVESLTANEIAPNSVTFYVCLQAQCAYRMEE